MEMEFVLKASNFIWIYEPIKILLSVSGAQWEWNEIQAPTYLETEMKHFSNQDVEKMKRSGVQSVLYQSVILLHNGQQVRRGFHTGVPGAVQIMKEVAKTTNFQNYRNLDQGLIHEMGIVAENLGQLLYRWSRFFVEDNQITKAALLLAVNEFTAEFLGALNNQAVARGKVYLFADEPGWVDIWLRHCSFYVQHVYGITLLDDYAKLQTIVESVNESPEVNEFLQTRPLMYI